MNLLRTATLATVLATSGCRAEAPINTTEIIILEDEDTCPVDPNTQAIEFSWLQAQAQVARCLSDAESNFQDCLQNDTDPDCFDQNNLDNEWCYYWEARKANKLPARVCGVNVYNISGTPDEEAYSREVNDEDEDGDGISTWYEYWMGYNPCTQTSFYSGECLGDGELDYDGDGVSNAEDESPICYGEYGAGDPGNYPSDCV